MRPEQSSSPKPTVLFAGSGDLTASALNTNFGQRVILVPPEIDLRVLVRREAAVTVPLPPNVQLHRPRLRGRLGLYVAAMRMMGRAFRDGVEVVVTDRSAVALAAWACRRMGNYRWIVDIWDVPDAEIVTAYARADSLRVRGRRMASRMKLVTFRRLLRRSDRVLASVLPEGLAIYQVHQSKLSAFPNAINLELFDPPSPDEVREPASICFVTMRFLSDRGVDVLVDAIQRLPHSQLGSLRVRLAGSLPPEIEAMIQESGASERIEILGEVSIHEAHRLMRRSEIGVVPHHGNEDLAYRYPVKLLEYMALGCVVVASDLPGIRTVIDHERQGLLVPPGDSAALARALARVLGDEPLRNRMRAAAHERVREFDARQKARAIYSVIGEAASQP